jgi:hypothetical protein
MANFQKHDSDKNQLSGNFQCRPFVRRSLQSHLQNSSRCHGLAPWSITLVALFRANECIQNCNVRLHGASPWHLPTQNRFSLVANVNHHGTSPWHHQTGSEFCKWLSRLLRLRDFTNYEGQAAIDGTDCSRGWAGKLSACGFGRWEYHTGSTFSSQNRRRSTE